MSSRVGVHLVTLLGLEIRRRLEQLRSAGDDLVMGSMRIDDVKIEVDLLRRAVGPLRTDMIRRELHTDSPLAGAVKDAVPRLVLEDLPTEDFGPERTLCM